MKKAALLILLAVSITIILSSYQKKQPKSQDELISEYIVGELEKKRVEEWRKCHSQTILDAEHYVDSIIYQQVNFNIGDTLKAPGKPIKPKIPFDTLKLDTSPILPILGDTL